MFLQQLRKEVKKLNGVSTSPRVNLFDRLDDRSSTNTNEDDASSTKSHEGDSSSTQSQEDDASSTQSHEDVASDDKQRNLRPRKRVQYYK